MLFSFQYVYFHEITFTGKWNIHPWDNDIYSEELKNSIIQTGIIHPPFLLRSMDGSFEIISGRKRLIIADNYLESDKIGCFILPEKCSERSILDLLLTDQLTTQLSLAEKARFIQVAADHMTEEEIVRNFSKRLEVREHNTVVTEMLNLLTMDDAIIREIHEGRLQYKMIGELMRIKSPEDRLALVSLFKELSLGDGKQKKLFSLIRDLAFRGHSSIAEFLKSKELQNILNHSEMNAPQKAQHLGNFLQAKLTPTYQESEKTFANFTKELELPKNFTLSHSQSFETDEITLSIVFKDSTVCQQLLPEIKSVLKQMDRAEDWRLKANS